MSQADIMSLEPEFIWIAIRYYLPKLNAGNAKKFAKHDMKLNSPGSDLDLRT